MRELQSIRRDLKRSLARDFRSQLESLRSSYRLMLSNYKN